MSLDCSSFRHTIEESTSKKLSGTKLKCIFLITLKVVKAGLTIMQHPHELLQEGLKRYVPTFSLDIYHKISRLAKNILAK